MSPPGSDGGRPDPFALFYPMTQLPDKYRVTKSTLNSHPDYEPPKVHYGFPLDRIAIDQYAMKHGYPVDATVNGLAITIESIFIALQRAIGRELSVVWPLRYACEAMCVVGLYTNFTMIDEHTERFIKEKQGTAIEKIKEILRLHESAGPQWYFDTDVNEQKSRKCGRHRESTLQVIPQCPVMCSS